MPRTKRTIYGSKEQLSTHAARLALGSIPGTESLLLAVRRQSAGVDSWRPLRSALQHATADSSPRVWMTTDEFNRWFKEQAVLHIKRKREGPNPTEALNMNPRRKRQLIHGEDTPSKIEALACAHYAMRFDLPAEAQDDRAFDAWCVEHFGGPNYFLAAWLGITSSALAAAMLGYRMQAGQRVASKPRVALIRALDWVRRMGPVCPYGERPVAATFGKGDPA